MPVTRKEMAEVWALQQFMLDTAKPFAMYTEKLIARAKDGARIEDCEYTVSPYGCVKKQET
jgi:hypothetical protein